MPGTADRLASAWLTSASYHSHIDLLRAFAQRVEVDTKEVRIMGSKSVPLRALVAASSAKKAGFGVPSFGTEVARHSEQNYELVCIEIAL
jgi:hypothetical protein